MLHISHQMAAKFRSYFLTFRFLEDTKRYGQKWSWIIKSQYASVINDWMLELDLNII